MNSSPIDPEEKKLIRQRLLQFMDEPNKKVCDMQSLETQLPIDICKKLTAQNAVIISRIARLDYPQEWYDNKHEIDTLFFLLKSQLGQIYFQFSSKPL